MTTSAPTILITLSGPGGSIDVAARADRPLTELAGATAAILGLGPGPGLELGNGEIAAGHYRVGADPKPAALTASLAELGALDGDAIIYYHNRPPDSSDRH